MCCVWIGRTPRCLRCAGLLPQHGGGAAGAGGAGGETAPPAGDGGDLQHVPQPGLRAAVPPDAVSRAPGGGGGGRFRADGRGAA